MRPTVILKAAITLDGQIAASDGTSQWITSPEARADAHQLRASVDAVMVGAGTVVADDPRLTVRLDGYDDPQPTPVVVAGRRALPAEAQVFSRDPIVLAAGPLTVPGRVIVAPDGDGGVDLSLGLETLHGLGIRSVLVEGGAGLSGALVRGGLVDRGVVYVSARVAGGLGTPVLAGSWGTLEDAHPITYTSARMVGPDVRLEFEFA